MKDRIGNRLAVGDKVVVALPEAQVFGYVAEVQEHGVISGVRGLKGGRELMPGRVLVSCVIALPEDPSGNLVLQVVKVHDAEKDSQRGEDSTGRAN